MGYVMNTALYRWHCDKKRNVCQAYFLLTNGTSFEQIPTHSVYKKPLNFFSKDCVLEIKSNYSKTIYVVNTYTYLQFELFRLVEYFKIRLILHESK